MGLCRLICRGCIGLIARSMTNWISFFVSLLMLMLLLLPVCICMSPHPLGPVPVTSAVGGNEHVHTDTPPSCTQVHTPSKMTPVKREQRLRQKHSVDKSMAKVVLGYQPLTVFSSPTSTNPRSTTDVCSLCLSSSSGGHASYFFVSLAVVPAVMIYVAVVSPSAAAACPVLVILAQLYDSSPSTTMYFLALS